MTKLPAQEPQEGATEVHKIPLPPVEVWLANLDIAGAGSGSQYIIKDDEAFTLSLDVEFDGGSLLDFILCAGMEIDVTFAIEGFGKATEIDLKAPVVKTTKGQRKYTVELSVPGGPISQNMTAGVYKAGAVMTVKPCSPCDDLGPVAFGYISDVVFQVYTH